MPEIEGIKKTGISWQQIYLLTFRNHALDSHCANDGVVDLVPDPVPGWLAGPLQSFRPRECHGNVDLAQSSSVRFVSESKFQLDTDWDSQ